MTAPGDRKRILFVSPKKEAAPLLAQLRAAGHHVSLVDDLDQATALLTPGGFDQTLISGSALALLLKQRHLLEGTDADSWRRSTIAITHDLRRLLGSLESIVQPEGHDNALAAPGAEIAQVARTIKMLSVFLLELTEELDGGSGAGLALSRFDLEDAVETAAMAVYPSASDRRQRLVIDIDESVAYIVADRTKVRRILASLLAHASSQSGRLGTVSVRARRDLDECNVSVCYRGETMSTSELGDLFRPAPADSRPGVYTVQSLVEAHGGRLWIESEKSSGTTIFVSLPSPAVVPGESVLAITAT